MANAYAINFSYQASTNSFSAIWKLTRVMKAAGWTVVGVSDGTSSKRTLTTGTPANNSNDYWGNNSDPLLDSYPTAFNTQAAWIVMRGPETIKLSFTSAPGNLIPGEPVTQATSGATGEFLNLSWDSVNSTGWAVILPRTGTFDNSNIITGSTSSATFTPTALNTYGREVMFSKSSANNTQGTIYYVCADLTNESSILFSTIADSTGCTSSIPPAAGGTNNSFPSAGICVRGSAGTVSHSGFSSMSGNLNTFGQAACVNATPSAGVSADGSFYVTFTSATNPPTILMYTRCDVTDGPDIDPYVWFYPGSATSTTWTNGTTTTGLSLSSGVLYGDYDYTPGSSIVGYLGYVGRGCGVSARDKAVCFSHSPGTGEIAQSFYSSINITIANYPGSTLPYQRLHPSLFSFRTTEVFYKGVPRWLIILSAGAVFDHSDNKSFFIITARSGITTPSIGIGPLDGSTTPTGA